jgi:type II secretory pathway pseudopilin PulG
VPFRTHRSGFTLIELAIVVGVIIILLGVATPTLGGMLEERTVYNAAYQLLQRIRTIQQLTLTHRVGYPAYQMSFDSSGQSYSTTAIGKTIAYRMPSGTSFSLSGLASAVAPVSFDWRGRPCEGTTAAELALGFAATVSNSSGSKQVRVSVSPVLGRVSIVWTAR